MMKLSKETIALMKNFATINTNLLIKPGNVLSTISAAKSIYAQATVQEQFPQEFGIYDLNEFLGVINLFDNPDILFEDGSVKIVSGKNSVRYLCADESVLVAPSRQIKVPTPDASFDLTADDINMILKTASVLHAQDVAFKASGGELTAIVCDKKNVSHNSYQMDIGEIESPDFTAYLRVENLKLLPGSYTVSIAAKRIAQFSSPAVEYVLSLEADSVFSE